MNFIKKCHTKIVEIGVGRVVLSILALGLIILIIVTLSNGIKESKRIKAEEEGTTEVGTTLIEEGTTFSEEGTTYFEEDPAPSLDDYAEEVVILAKLTYCEARGVDSITEQACVMWTVLNRVDAYNETIEEVVLAPYQFCYSSGAPTIADNGCDLKKLAEDVILRWLLEKDGETNVGRVLPKDYLFFNGVDGHNWFKKECGVGVSWDYSLLSPYES